MNGKELWENQNVSHFRMAPTPYTQVFVLRAKLYVAMSCVYSFLAGKSEADYDHMLHAITHRCIAALRHGNLTTDSCFLHVPEQMATNTATWVGESVQKRRCSEEIHGNDEQIGISSIE